MFHSTTCLLHSVREDARKIPAVQRRVMQTFKKLGFVFLLGLFVGLLGGAYKAGFSNGRAAMKKQIYMQLDGKL